jgi:hypothetical protein
MGEAAVSGTGGVLQQHVTNTRNRVAPVTAPNSAAVTTRGSACRQVRQSQSAQIAGHCLTTPQAVPPAALTTVPSNLHSCKLQANPCCSCRHPPPYTHTHTSGRSPLR